MSDPRQQGHGDDDKLATIQADPSCSSSSSPSNQRHTQISTAQDVVASNSTAIPESNTTSTRRAAFLRSASIPTLLDTRTPKLTPRWLFADGKEWVACSIGDSTRLEEGLQQWHSEGGHRGGASEEETKGEESVDPPPLPEADPTEPLPTWRIPVGGDRLFEVDLRPSPPLMHPVFWKAPPLQVRRGSWFFESSRILPCDLDLTAELTKLYEEIRPWTKAYAEELRISAGIGAEGEEKLKCPLSSLKGSYVIFSGSHIARIYQEGVSTRLAKTLLTAWAGEHGGGTVVVRGWDQAQKLMSARKGDLKKKKKASRQNLDHARSSSISKRTSSSGGIAGNETPKQHMGGDESPLPAGSAQPPTKDVDGEDTSASQRSTSSTMTPSSSQQADLWSSLTSRLSSWGYSSSSSSQLTEKQRTDVAESFKEAQAKIQESGQEGEIRKSKQDPSPLRAAVTTDSPGEDVALEEEATDDEEEEWEKERQQDEEEVELIICWHGIGQKLADEWKKLEFSIAVTAFQSLVRARAKTPAPAHIGGPGLAGLAKGKRLVFVPINWRATLNDFQPTKERDDEDVDDEEHLDNQVGLDDIFGTNDSIPLARQVTKNLLLDIPLFLSHHRQEVLRRCVAETNRAYALFCQRNPTFVSRAREKSSEPKVSMICHSLGAALAIDILSAQPTWVGPFTSSEQMLSSPHLAYNTRSLYLIGSPAALFYYLQSRQLISRKGRELTLNCRKDESLDRPEGGHWGCLSVDRIWNVFNPTDPIATCLNGCVDTRSAAKMPAVAVDKVVNALLATLPGSASSDDHAGATTKERGEGVKGGSSTGTGTEMNSNEQSMGEKESSASASSKTSSTARSLLATWSKRRLPPPTTVPPPPSTSSTAQKESDEDSPDLGEDVRTSSSFKEKRQEEARREDSVSSGRTRSKDAWAEKWARRKKAEEEEKERRRREKKTSSEDRIGEEGKRMGMDDKIGGEGRGVEGLDAQVVAGYSYPPRPILPQEVEESAVDLKNDDADSKNDEAATDGSMSKGEDEVVQSSSDASSGVAAMEQLNEAANVALLAVASVVSPPDRAVDSPPHEGGDSRVEEEEGKTISQLNLGDSSSKKEDTIRPNPSSSFSSPLENNSASKTTPPPPPPPPLPTTTTTGPCQRHTLRAKKRFQSLNPLGRIDYVLPRPTGSLDLLLSPSAAVAQLLEYLGMLQAHATYWSNEHFADLVLASASASLERLSGGAAAAAGAGNGAGAGEESNPQTPPQVQITIDSSSSGSRREVGSRWKAARMSLFGDEEEEEDECDDDCDDYEEVGGTGRDGGGSGSGGGGDNGEVEKKKNKKGEGS